MNISFSKNSIGIQVLRVLDKQTGAVSSETVADLMKVKDQEERKRVNKACLNLEDSGYVQKKKVWRGSDCGQFVKSRLTVVFAITDKGRDQVAVYPEPDAGPCELKKIGVIFNGVVYLKPDAYPVDELDCGELPDDIVQRKVSADACARDIHPDAVSSIFELADREAFRGVFDSIAAEGAAP